MTAWPPSKFGRDKLDTSSSLRAALIDQTVHWTRTDEAPWGILLASHFKCVSHGTSADSSVGGSIFIQLPSALARDIDPYSHRWKGFKADTKFFIESVTLEPGIVHGTAWHLPLRL